MYVWIFHSDFPPIYKSTGNHLFYLNQIFENLLFERLGKIELNKVIPVIGSLIKSPIILVIFPVVLVC